MTIPVSLTGRVTVAPIYKTSKKGAGYCQFAIADERAGVTSCMAFDPLAKALAGTFPLVDQWVVVTGQMKDGKLMADRVVPRDANRATAALKKLSPSRAEVRDETEIESLIGVLGAKRVNERLREWLGTSSGVSVGKILAGGKFSVAGYRKVIDELKMEAIEKL
jgi:hypothetical protein